MSIGCFLVTCSDPKSTIILTDPDKWKATLREPILKLSDNEKKMLLAWMLKAKARELFGKEKMKEGVTISQALDEQRQFEEKQKAK